MGNHEDLQRREQEDKLYIQVDNDGIPGSSIVKLLAPVTGSQSKQTMLDGIDSRYRPELRRLMMATHDANQAGDRDAHRRAENAYTKLLARKTAEIKELNRVVKDVHGGDPAKMARTVTTFVLKDDWQVSPLQKDISMVFKGGPKKCAHCVAQARDDAHNAFVNAGGAPLPGYVAPPAGGGAGGAAGAVYATAEEAMDAAEKDVPFCDESEPRVLEIELIKLDTKEVNQGRMSLG